MEIKNINYKRKETRLQKEKMNMEGVIKTGSEREKRRKQKA